jgi:anti-sigma factor RsiW
MKCAACRPLLSKYVDGEATFAEMRLIEEHIGGCASCTEALTEFRLMRSAFYQAPQRTPDPRIRAGLFKAIEEFEAHRPADERVRRPAPRPVAPAPRRLPHPAWSWLGNLAGVAAVLSLVATSFLLVNIGRQQRDPVSSGTPAATDEALATLVVPTQPAAALTGSTDAGVPGAERTPGAPPLANDPLNMPRTATGPPVWHMADEAATAPDGHAIRDAQFGYLITYPANGWSASAPASDPAVLGRRLVAPWPMDPAQATLPFYMVIDVLTGTATIPAYTETVSYNTWQGTRGIRKEGNQDIDEVLLRQDPYIYRLDYLQMTGAPAPEGTGWAKAIRQSFQPASDLAGHPFGYAPALVLRGGDLWSADATGSGLRQLTTSGTVRAFSLAPDLHTVALVTAVRAEDTRGTYVELLDLAQGGAPRRIWIAKEVHEVAWDGTQALVAIGIDQSGDLGLYRLNRNLEGTDHLSTLPNGNAHSLQIAPDRTWIGFLSDTSRGMSELYGVRPDGSGQAPIMPRTGGTNGTPRNVREFAWLPATVADGPLGTESLVVLEQQAGDSAVVPASLILPPPTSGLSPSVTLFGTAASGQARFLAVSPAGQVAYALFAGGTCQGLQTCTVDTPSLGGAGHCGAVLPIGAAPSALQWAADNQHLLVQSQDAGAFDLQRLDLSTH